MENFIYNFEFYTLLVHIINRIKLDTLNFLIFIKKEIFCIVILTFVFQFIFQYYSKVIGKWKKYRFKSQLKISLFIITSIFFIIYTSTNWPYLINVSFFSSYINCLITLLLYMIHRVLILVCILPLLFFESRFLVTQVLGIASKFFAQISDILIFPWFYCFPQGVKYVRLGQVLSTMFYRSLGTFWFSISINSLVPNLLNNYIFNPKKLKKGIDIIGLLKPKNLDPLFIGIRKCNINNSIIILRASTVKHYLKVIK